MRQVVRTGFHLRLFSVTSALLHKICLILMDYSMFVMETNLVEHPLDSLKIRVV